MDSLVSQPFGFLDVLVACYLVGGIPFGVIIGKITKGIDIRDFGSGNIGATNVYRALGPGPAILVLLLDTAKGLVAVELCKRLGLNQYWVVAGGLISILGHTFSVFLRFHGGRGVATALGVIIGLNPVIAGIAFAMWMLLVAVTRYVSVASILATASVPLQMILWKSMKVPVAYQAMAVVAATAIVVRHIPNVRRLIDGTEPKFGQRLPTEKDASGDADD